MILLYKCFNSLLINRLYAVDNVTEISIHFRLVTNIAVFNYLHYPLKIELAFYYHGNTIEIKPTWLRLSAVVIFAHEITTPQATSNKWLVHWIQYITELTKNSFSRRHLLRIQLTKRFLIVIRRLDSSLKHHLDISIFSTR